MAMRVKITPSSVHIFRDKIRLAKFKTGIVGKFKSGGYVFALKEKKLVVTSDRDFGSDEFSLNNIVEREVIFQLGFPELMFVCFLVFSLILAIWFVGGVASFLGVWASNLQQENVLERGESLLLGNTLTSPNKLFTLSLDSISSLSLDVTKDGQLVPKHASCDLVITRSAEYDYPDQLKSTHRHTLSKKACSRLSMQSDNNLVAYDESSKPVWASNTVSWYDRDKLLLTNRGEVKLGEEVICMYITKKQNTEVPPKDSVPPQTPKEASEADIPEPSTTLPKEQNSEVPPKEEFEYRLLVRTLKELREDGEHGTNTNLPKEQNSEVPPKKDPKHNVLRAGESIYGYKMPGPYNTKYKTTMLEWTGTCGFDIKDIKNGKAQWLKLSTAPCNMIEMQADGNLMAYHKSHKNLVWSSKTGGSPGNYLELTDDGEFYIKTKVGKVVGVL